MRFLMTSCAILLALVAFGPTQTMAKDPGGPITITNPATNGVSLSDTFNGVAYTIAPGYSQAFREDRAWVLQFSRDGDDELTRKSPFTQVEGRMAVDTWIRPEP